MVASWHCLDWVVLEGMSQVSRRSEVGDHKRRTLNTRLSSGTSAGTFAVSSGPHIQFVCLFICLKYYADWFRLDYDFRLFRSTVGFCWNARAYLTESSLQSISSNSFLWKRTNCLVVIKTWSWRGKPVASARAWLWEADQWIKQLLKMFGPELIRINS